MRACIHCCILQKSIQLDSSLSSTRALSWPLRVPLALQTAKAIRALHSSCPPIVHRNIRAMNLFISRNWNTRLWEFGLARHVQDTEMLVAPPRKSNLSSIPEIEPFVGDADCRSADSAAVFSTLTKPETDVLSLGVLLLEIISGRNARDAVECGLHSLSSLINWALPLIKRRKALAICDPRIKFPLCTTALKHMATIAGRCVHPPDSKLHTAAVNA